MSAAATPALVLHAFDYRESSRIVRLLTRDAGVVSVIARGVRRPRARTASGLDLFTSGTLHWRRATTGDLHQLVGFDAERARPALAAALPRFAAAAALAELALRVGGDEAVGGGLWLTLTDAVDRLAAATADAAAVVGLSAAWRLVAESGHQPAVDQCAHCHDDLPTDVEVPFHHRAGGALCPRCAARAAGLVRRLPPDARDALRAWLSGVDQPVPSLAHRAAHRRLLREFVDEHLGTDRPWRALDAWGRSDPA